MADVQVPWKKRWPGKDCIRIEVQDGRGIGRITVEAMLNPETRKLADALIGALVADAVARLPLPEKQKEP